ncbi:ABC transporter permease [Microbacterium sp. A588]
MRSIAVRLGSRKARQYGLALVFLAVLVYLVVVPLFHIQSLALRDGAAGYRSALMTDGFGEVILNTIYLSVGSVVIAMVLGTALALAADRLPSRAAFIRAIPVLPLVLPAIANVIGWQFLLSPGPGYLNAVLRMLPWWSGLEEGPVNVYSVTWIVIITGFGLTSFVYLFVSSGLSNINADHLEAARMSGSSPGSVFLRVTLPQLRPSLVYAAGVTFLLGMGQFTAPLILGTNSGVRVITTEIYRRTAESPVDFAAAAALGSPLVLIGLLLVVAQRRAIGDESRFITHGGKGFVATSRRSGGARVFILIYGIVALLIPLTGLLFVSLSPYWSADISAVRLSFDNFLDAFSRPTFLDAIWNSIVLSAVAMLIATVGGYIAACIMLQSRMRVIRWITDAVISLPLGIPAVIFGVGFLFTYTQPPFVLYGTPVVIVLVYATLMFPFAVRMLLTGMMALGPAYAEASRMSGAGVLRTHLKIVIPLIRTSLAGAAVLMFILLTHEFAASLLVRSAKTQVMGTILYDYWASGAYPLVAAVALIMTGVTALGVVLALAVGGRNALSRL